MPNQKGIKTGSNEIWDRAYNQYITFFGNELNSFAILAFNHVLSNKVKECWRLG
jgi:hypothetical protein